MAPLHVEPDASSEQVTQALRSEPLAAERRDDWGERGRVVPRDAGLQEEAGVEVAEPRYGDLVTYGREATTHIAFLARRRSHSPRSG